VWPTPDDRDGDLNHHPGPAWLDRAATGVRERLAGLRVRAFNAKKQRMGGGGPHLDRLAREVGERMVRAGLQPPPGSG